MIQDISYKVISNVRIVSADTLLGGQYFITVLMRGVFSTTIVEVIPNGHNRNVEEIRTSLQDNVKAITNTIYQSYHHEYFQFLYNLFRSMLSGWYWNRCIFENTKLELNPANKVFLLPGMTIIEKQNISIIRP